MTAEDRLYRLLPSIYRQQDATQGEPLRALLGVIETELQRVEADIDQLYDNWFVETCAEWVVPYLGDLMGVRGLLPVEGGVFSQRAFVANTLGYRRRKGTAAMLEQLARDVTGWTAKVLEAFQSLSTTQYLNHVRRDLPHTVDLRRNNQLELINTPFDRAAHSVDVRQIDIERGLHNIANIALFIWRLQSYAVTRSTARAVSTTPDGRYSFNPLGIDQPLFNVPRTETAITQLASEENVAGRLRRRALHDELTALANGTPRPTNYFSNPPVMQLFVKAQANDPAPIAVPVSDLVIADLRDYNNDWQRPPVGKIAIDPKLGRLAFPMQELPAAVEVSYAYGATGDLGGGPYNRQASLNRWLSPTEPRKLWQIGVRQDAKVGETDLRPTLSGAIGAWNNHWDDPNPAMFGIIVIMDSHTYAEDLTSSRRIVVRPGSKLAIVAANWPAQPDPVVPGVSQRVVGQLLPDDLRPHLRGNINIFGQGDTTIEGGEVILDGLLIEGILTVVSGNLSGLRLFNTTLVPGVTLASDGTPQQPNQASLTVQSGNTRLEIEIDHSITGPLRIPSEASGLSVRDSVIDAPIRPLQKTVGSNGRAAIGATTDGTEPGPPALIERSTIFGSVQVKELALASEVIFTSGVFVARRQIGCVRFSYVSPASQVPRRFRCLPTAEEEVTPAFVATRYGEPGYAQLSTNAPEAILTGAEDEGELGVFNSLQQTQRRNNLRSSLTEYVRFGLELGVFFID